jgi:transposase
MARRISLEPHLTIEELEGRYRSTKDPVERSRWHFLWLLARGLTATVIASISGYSAYWIGRIARRYNQHGPAGVKDLRHQSRPSTPLLSGSQQDELVAALAAGGAPEGERWSGRTVAAWISQRLGRRVGRQLGWAYLRRLGARLRVPRPRHVHADPQVQTDFKKRLRPLLRDVATAFPQATVELWVVDEHRIGLKPILRKVWTLPGQRPIAPVEHRYDWRYLVGFVHPASGRPVWHLATTVNIPLFETELAPFAQKVGRVRPNRSCSCSTGPAGMKVLGCMYPNMSTCCSCRRTLPNSSRLNICGRSRTPSWPTSTSPASRPWRMLRRSAASRCKPVRTSSAPPRCFRGGRATSSDDKGPEGSEPGTPSRPPGGDWPAAQGASSRLGRATPSRGSVQHGRGDRGQWGVPADDTLTRSRRGAWGVWGAHGTTS